jgi:hypothetical protein
MSKPPKDDQYSDKETKERAEKALRGAFKTPPPKAREVREPKPAKPPADDR